MVVAPARRGHRIRLTGPLNPHARGVSHMTVVLAGSLAGPITPQNRAAVAISSTSETPGDVAWIARMFILYVIR